MPASPASDYILTIDGPQRPGIVHALTGFLLEHSGDIIELKQYDDLRAGHYFSRIHVAFTPDPGEATLGADLEALAARWGLRILLRPGHRKQRVLVMVSKFEHCLADLLFRARMGELPIEIAAVVSNHPTHRSLTEWHQIPFFHVPVAADTKPAAEARLLELVDRFEIDFVVLARYMQILSPELCAALEGRAINIHHSFLPGFKGANPYKQAHQRGVKLIGATAHYVTTDLDEGPIIEQDTVRVDHAYSVRELTQLGQDEEARVLRRAVGWYAENRVLLDGARTIIFR